MNVFCVIKKTSKEQLELKRLHRALESSTNKTNLNSNEVLKNGQWSSELQKKGRKTENRAYSL